MTHSSTKTKLIAAITVLAVALACVFAAVFYTRTGEENDAPAESGESATTFPLDYGDPVENTVPSGAAEIKNQEQFYAFINGTYPYDTASYGYLTDNITLSTWVRGDLVLDSGRTLDGRGKTVTIVNDTTSSGTKPSAGADRALAHTMLSVFDADYRGSNHIGERAWYDAWWGADNMSGNYYSINGKQSYALSDIVSVNRGTIKNLKVQMNGHSDGVVDHIALATEDGNVSMGVIAGINEGDIINCTVDVNDRYGIVPSDIVVTGKSNVSLYSRQDMVAVGGVVGYNTGNIVGTEVNLNNGSLGIYRSQKRFREDKIVNPAEGTISNMSIDSGSLGGVAGINDGGTITGLDFYINNCWLYNDAWHWQTSYTGLLVGLSNSSNAAADYNLDGSNWTIDPGVITNLTIDWAEGVKVATEAHGNGSLSGYRDSGRGASISAGNYGTGMPQGNWQAVGNYVGIIAGRMTTAAGGSSYIAAQINVYNTNFNKSVSGNNGVRWNFHPWETDEVNNGYGNEYPITDPYFPIYGYGNNEAAYGTITTIDTKLEGQYLSGENTGTSITSQGATASYIWSGGVGASGEAYSGLLQNIELSPMFDNVEPSIYKFVGYVGGEQTSSADSTNYMGDIGKSNLLIVPTDTTGSQISLEYRYSVTAKALPTADSLDAFFGVNEGSGFGYAYANAAVLTADNTVSDKPLAPSGSRVFPDWKTFDGKGHSLIINSVGASVSSSATQEVGGMRFNAYGDLIAINNGTIVDVNVRFEGQGGRGDISGVSGNVAYGNVVGINNGTLNDVKLNDAVNMKLRTRVLTSGAYLALGGVAGINLGTINTVHVITWSEFYGSAQSGTFVGGVVGLNSGDGKIWNVKADGDGCTITASGGEAYVGGVLGLGENSSDATRKVVDLTVNSTLTENGTHVSPFRNWLYTGKRHVATANAYSGFLAGAVAVNATESASNPAITGMLVLMPETSSEIGWFTGATGTPSLLGRVGSSAGYVATDLVGGANIIAADASKNYASAAVSNWNGDWNSEYSTASVYFDSDIYNNSTYVNTVNSITLQYRNMAAPSSGVSFTPNLTASRQNVSLPSTILEAENAVNEGNYAQTIALYYDYEAKIFDGAAADHPLRHFLSGETPAATYGTHNAIAAGATSAILTANVNVNASVNGVVFEAPKTALKGNGKKITIAGYFGGTLNGGAVNAAYDSEHNYYGDLVAINNATIDNVTIEVSGSRELICDNVVYGVVAGLNRGTINNTVVTVTGDVTVTSASGYNVYGMVGINSYPSAMGVDNFTMTGAVTLDGSYSNGYLGMVGVNYAAPLTNAHATWVGSVSMTGSADYFGGLVGYAHDNQKIQNSSATFGYGGQTYYSLLNGDIYNNRYTVSLGGTDNFFGGAIGTMAGGTASSLGAVFNVDVDVTGGDSGLNDVGGLIGRITGGTATSATVSGLGALAVQGTGTIRMGGAVGAAGIDPTLTDVKAMLAGGLYNVNMPGDYGWWSGYNEGGVTVNGAVFVVHDGKEYSAENAYGGSPTGTLGGGYRIVDMSGNDVDYLAVDPATMTTVGAPSFVTSGSALTVAPGSGAESINEYTLSSDVTLYTDHTKSSYMLLSALSGLPYRDDYVRQDYSDYAQSRNRFYGWYAGAGTVTLGDEPAIATQQSILYLLDPSVPLVLDKGRVFDGNRAAGYSIEVSGDMNDNVAAYEMIWEEETEGGGTEIVNSGTYAAHGMFLAINRGTIRNIDLTINGDLNVSYSSAFEKLDDIDADGVIFGMLVGVNTGTITGFTDIDYGRVTTIDVDAMYMDGDLIVGGMVGLVAGDNALIDGVGTVTFGTGASDGSGDGIEIITTNQRGGQIDRLAVGGLIGMVGNTGADISVSGLHLVMKAYSFIDINVPHGFAALGGIVGDLRGRMADTRIDTEYLSRMLVGGTLQGGTTALGNLVGIANGAYIERAVVKGVGYLYNGIDENSAQQSGSIDLYSGGAIGLASNIGQDTSIAAQTYMRINPSTLDSVYVDFEGYLRAVNGSKVGLITGRLFDGVTVGEDGTTVTKKIDATKLKNVVWKVNYYGDVPWASSAYINNVSTVFNERTELAVYGYAAADVNNYGDLAQRGIRLWLTNSRFAGELNNDIDAVWASNGKLTFTIGEITDALSYRSYTAYYNGEANSGQEGITEVQQMNSSSGGTPPASATVSIDEALATFANASANMAGIDASHGVYVIEITFDEVLITNQEQLMTFISSGKNAKDKTTSGQTNIASWMYGLATTDADYSKYANADIGVLGASFNVDFGATAVTMSARKSLDGQGHTITLTASGTKSAYQIWTDRGEAVAAEDRAIGILEDGETAISYVSGGENYGGRGGSQFDDADITAITTAGGSLAGQRLGQVGVGVGGLFMGRNLGTIANINFVLKNSVTIHNNGYGAMLVTGVITAVNAGTIENCSLTLNEGVEFLADRTACTDKERGNELNNGKEGQINTIVAAAGYAGYMLRDGGDAGATAYIRNCTLDLKTGSAIKTQNAWPTFHWDGRKTSLLAFAGGLVGWMMGGTEIYNVVLNGEGDVVARALNDITTESGGFADWNNEFVYGIGGIIVGLNSTHEMFNPIYVNAHYENHGFINGVICNWNGNVEYSAMDDAATSETATYYLASKKNYSMGGQMVGVCEEDALQNVYFMYGVENYVTYHRDNYYYGETSDTRATNADFAAKYEYIVSRTQMVLSTLAPRQFDAVSVTVNVNGATQMMDIGTLDENGEYVPNPEFTVQMYASHAGRDTNESSLVGSGYDGANYGVYGRKGNTYTSIIDRYFHKIVNPSSQVGGTYYTDDLIGARTSGKMTYVANGDWINQPSTYYIRDYDTQYAPNNVYIYEVAFGESEKRELDMNDPQTVASMSFETDQITSDIRLDFELYTDENLAQFIWSIEEVWEYPDGSGIDDTTQKTDYYNTVNSLEEAMRNNKFDRTMRRDNDSVNIRITYYIGSAISIAPDLDRYTPVSTEDEEGNITQMTYYDSLPYIYNGRDIGVPDIYYVSLNDPSVKLSDTPVALPENAFDFYSILASGEAGSEIEFDTESGAPRDVGEYYIRLQFDTLGEGNHIANVTDRTVMFGIDAEYYDFYTAILPAGLSDVFVSKVYDGTADATDATTFDTGDAHITIKGEFSQSDSGTQDEVDYEVDMTALVYFRTVSGENGTVTTHTIRRVTDMDGNATNYALVRRTLPSDTSGITADVDLYYYSSAAAQDVNAEITPYEITKQALDLWLTDGGGTRRDWNTDSETQVEYAYRYAYDLSRFASSGSQVTVGGNSFAIGSDGRIKDMFTTDDFVEFEMTFDGQPSVSDKGEYETVIAIADTNNGNFVFEGGTAEMNIGRLVITEIVIETAGFSYTLGDDLTFVYNGDIPDVADFGGDFGGVLTVMDGDNVLEYGVDYTSIKLEYTIVNAGSDVSVGGYALRVTVSDFVSVNYVLPNNGASFDINIENARLYITPKLIEFESIVKQYDGNAEQTEDTLFDYTVDNAPIDADEGVVFHGEYNGDSYLTAGGGKRFDLSTEPITINGESYNALTVDDGSINYYVEDASPAVGGITPVKVEIESVSMRYSGATQLNYNDPYNAAVVIVRADNGESVDIRPDGEFANRRVGTRAITFTTKTISDGLKDYDVLVAVDRDYQGNDCPNATQGDNFPGNYYLDSATFADGEIYQYTIEAEHFFVTITQEWNSDSASFEVRGAEINSANNNDGFTYHAGNTFGGAAEEGSNWVNADEIAETILVEIAYSEGDGEEGDVGVYAVTLTIVVSEGTADYEWSAELDEDDDGELTFEYEVAKQEIETEAKAVIDGDDSYVYNGGRQNIEISASVSDIDGNELTLEPSVSDATNATLGGSYSMNGTLPIGDYTAEVGVRLSAEDAVNYIYEGGETSVSFAVTPAPVEVNGVQKEFDNTVATDTSGNNAKFNMSGFADDTQATSFVGEAYYRNSAPQTNGEVLFPIKSYTIGGTRYDVLTVGGEQINHFIDGATREDGYSVVGGVGVIDKYAIGSGEVTTYIYGYTSGAAEKSMKEAVDGAQFEYRAGASYTSADVVFDLDLRYGFADGDVPSGAPQIGDITALSFTVTISGDAELPGVGEYTISVSLNNDYFTLDQGAANGVFEIVKQSVSGGSQDPDNPDAGFTGGNVFITAALYSKRYGDEGYAGPEVGDQTVVLTVTVTDKYDQTTKVPFDKTVVTSLLYGVDEGSRAAQIAGVDGLFVGEYLVWATAFTEELGNYAIPTDAVIPVFPAGTPPPQTDEEGNDIGAQHTAVYAITPATAAITSVDKTYDGTTSFTGATITAAAPQEVAAAITGSYLSPDATHASDGVTRIEGQGNTSVVINTTALELQNAYYNMIATSGVAGNYCVVGVQTDSGVQVDDVAIIRRLVIADESAVTITSQKFAKTYDATADVDIPEGITMTMTVNFPAGDDGTTPAPLVVTLTPTAEGLIFLGADGVPLEAAPTDVGAYGVALAPVGMGNFELPSGANVPVTPTAPHAEGDSAIYYIEPVELTIKQLSKTYDGSAALTESTVFAADVALDGVTVTRDMIAVAFDTANIGIGKSALVSVVSFTLADGTPVYRVLGADGVTPTNFFVQGTLSGAAVAVTAPADAEAPFTIAPAPLSLNVGTVVKTYDGTTAITASPTAAFTGFVPGETIAPDWYYDSANAGTRNVLVRVDNSIEYVVGDVTYYAVMTAGEEGAMGAGNYGVDKAIAAAQTVWVTDPESGELTAVEQWYAVFTGGGRIDKFAITGITDVEVGGDPIGDEREYDSWFNDRVDFVVDFGGEGTASGAGSSTATVTAPFSQTSVSEEDGSQTSTNDSLRFRLRWDADPGNVGNYTLTIELDSSYGSAGNYSMSDYTGTLVIVPKELDGVFAVIAQLTKEYDGTTTLPTLDRAMVTFYGVDGDAVLTNDGKFMLGEGGGIAFVDAEGMPLEGDALPVNVLIGEDGTIGGYEFRLTGVVFNDTNYVWDTGVVTRIYTSYEYTDSGEVYGAQTLYTITPKQLTVNADSLTDKTFDGAFSLSVDTGVEGEYAIVGDANGAVGALAGVYGGVTITPKVLGVTFDSSALNPTTTDANYTIAGGEVTIDNLTIGTGNVLTAERALGEYRIGFGGMAGLDFLAGAGADEAAIAAAIAALVATAESGEPLRADGYTSGDPVALLNDALISLFEVKLNTASVTLEGGKLYFNDFLWSAVTDGMERTTYSLTFSFTGVDGYDADGFATDRYEFVLKGATAADGGDYIPSTNASLTSSELAPGQLAEAAQNEGTAIATADDLLAFLKGGSGIGHLTADIYGFDAAGEGVTFGGTLYGNGHTIQLTPSDLAAVQSGGYDAYGALVAVNNGTIRDVNLKLMGCDLAFEQSNSVFGAVGVNNGDLVNVSVEVVGTLNIDGAQYAGALTAVNTGTITDCAATVSGAVNMTSTSGETVTPSGTFGGLAARAGGAMNRVAAYDSGSVSAADGGAIVGEADSLTIDGVIAAAAWGVKGVVGSGTPTVSGLYVNTAADLGVTADALGDALSLLAPHTEGFIQYYFTSEGDFTSDGVRHNEFGSAGETNMSGYGIYADDLTSVIAVEAIAEMGKYIWEGYGISYLTAADGGSIGTGLNRVVGVFALGSSLAGQYDSETATQGVGAFVVALGGFGSTIVAEGTASVKEVIYNGTAQEYTVTLTVDGEEQEVTVSGTAVGYYSKSFVEGVISGGSTTVGNITFDLDNRVAYTVEGGGSSVSDGIALIIHPKTADTVYADKYYDGNSDATASLSDSAAAVGDKVSLSGAYVDESYAVTVNANEAKYVTIVNATTAVRTVLVDGQGNFVHLVVTDEGAEFVPVTIGEDKATFGVATPLEGYSVAEIMRAYAMLTDYADIVGVEGVDTTGYTSADVFVVTGVWSGSEFGGTLLFAPGSGNLNLTDPAWKAQITALAVPQDFDWSTLAKYTIEGTINPIDLNIGVTIGGADQSYNHPIVEPTTSGGAAKVNMTFEEAAEKYGLMEEEYELLVSQTESIEVAAVSGMFAQLVQEGKLVANGDGTYSAAAKEYQQFTIATSGGTDTDSTGNFIVGASGTLTLRYFEPDIDIEDGKTTYLLGSLADWRALQSNEGGAADYNTLDYRLSADIDFGGEGAMLAWRTAEGNMLDFTGTLDGGEHVLSNIFEFNEGTGAKSALIESIGEDGVVKNLTVVDSVFDAFGDNTVTAGIAIDNHGTIENCTFEGTLAGGSTSASAAVLAGLVANNFGTIKGGTAVADGLIFAAENGTTDAVGIAFNEGETASVESSNAVAAIRAYGGASGTLGGAVDGSNAGTGNGYVAGLASRDGAAVTDGDTSSDGTLVWRNSASVKAVIEKYVFNTQLVGYNGTVLDTDNFRKLIAALRLFEFVGAADVTNSAATAWGKYAAWLAAHALN